MSGRQVATPTDYLKEFRRGSSLRFVEQRRRCPLNVCLFSPSTTLHVKRKARNQRKARVLTVRCSGRSSESVIGIVASTSRDRPRKSSSQCDTLAVFSFAYFTCFHGTLLRIVRRTTREKRAAVESQSATGTQPHRCRFPSRNRFGEETTARSQAQEDEALVSLLAARVQPTGEHRRFPRYL